MNHFRSALHVLVAVLVGTAIFGAPSRAEAGFTFAVRYSTDGTGDYNEIDGTVVNMGGVLVGIVNNNNPININGQSLAITASFAGNLLELHLNGTYTTSLSYNLLVQATVTGLTITPATLTTNFTNSKVDSGPPVTAQSWIDTSNASWGMVGPTTGSLNPGDNFTTGVFSSSTAYSLTTQIEIAAGSSIGQIGADDRNTITPTPAPGGLVLMLGAVPLVALRVRRRAPAAV